MAATFPQEVEAAAAWSRANPNMKGDDAVKAVASQPWDPSVQSLVAFPQVLATMASKPDWVAQIGNAFLAQPNDRLHTAGISIRSPDEMKSSRAASAATNTQR